MNQLARSSSQLGAIIQRQRRQLGLTQTQLAKRTGLRQDTISLAETGGSDVRLNTLLAILGALDLELRVADRTKSNAADIEAIF